VSFLDTLNKYNPLSGANTASTLNPMSYMGISKKTGEPEWTEDSYNRYLQAIIRQQGQAAALTSVADWAYKEPGVKPGQPFFGPKRQVFPMTPSKKTGAPQEIDPRLNPWQARLRAGPRGPSFKSPWIGGF